MIKFGSKSGVKTPGVGNDSIAEIIIAAFNNTFLGDDSKDLTKMKQAAKNYGEGNQKGMLGAIGLILQAINGNTKKLSSKTSLISTTEAILDLTKDSTEAIVEMRDMLEEYIGGDGGGKKSDTSKKNIKITFGDKKSIKYLNLLIEAAGNVPKAAEKRLLGVSKGINSILETIKKHERDIQSVEKLIKTFATAVMMLAGTLIAGALLTKLIGVKDVLKFTGLLSMFVMVMGGIFVLMSKLTKREISKSLSTFATYITISAGLMIAGAMFAKIIEWSDVLEFTSMLTSFVIKTMMPFIMFSLMSILPGVGNPMDGLKDFALYLIVCSGLLIAGGMLANVIDWDGAMEFTNMLSHFVWMTLMPFMIFSMLGSGVQISVFRKAKSPWESIRYYMEYLILCTGILLAAPLIMDHIDVPKVIQFTVLLMGFVWATLWPFIRYHRRLKRAFRDIRKFTLFIVVAAGILMAGGMLFDMIDKPALIGFAVTLTLFVRFLIKAVHVKGKKLKRALLNVQELMLLVGFSAAILLIGGGLYVKWPDLIWAVPAFAVTLLGFVHGLKLVIKALDDQKIQAGLKKGMLVLGGLTLIIIAGAFAMGLVADFMNKVDDPMIIIEGLGIMGLAIVEMGALAWAATLAAPGIAIGVPMMLLISGAIIAMAYGMKLLESIDHSNWESVYGENGLTKKLGKFLISVLGDEDSPFVILNGGTKLYDPERKGFGGFVTGLISNIGAGISGATIAMAVGAAVITMLEISVGLGAIASAIKTWADLKIPSGYDAKGKPTGYISLGDDDFVKASKNIGMSTAALLEPVLHMANGEVYRDGQWHKEEGFAELLAEAGSASIWRNLFGTSSRLLNAINAVRELGKALVPLGIGIQQWASLKIPSKWNNEGKAIDFVTIKDAEFAQAGQNIGKTTTTLVTALLDVANEPRFKELLDDMGSTPGVLETWFRAMTIGWKKSPVLNVIKVIKLLGKSLVSLAKGIKEWVDLKIAQYDNNGNITGYITIADNDFEKAAMNIKKVVLFMTDALGEAVTGKNFQAFNDGLFTDSPAANAAKAMLTTSEMLGNMTQIIGYWAGMRFPIFKKGGDGSLEPTGIMIEVTEEGFKEAQINIRKILLFMASAMSDVVNIFKYGENGYDAGDFGKDVLNFFSFGLSGLIDSVTFNNEVSGISECMNNLTKTLSDMTDVIAKIYNDPVLKQEGVFEEVTEKLSNMLSSVVTIVALFGSTAAVPRMVGKAFELYGLGDMNDPAVVNAIANDGGFSGFWSGRYSLAEYLNEQIGSGGELMKFMKAFPKLTDKINEFITIYDAFATSFTSGIGKNVVDNLEFVTKSIVDMLSGMVTIVASFSSEAFAVKIFEQNGLGKVEDSLAEYFDDNYDDVVDAVKDMTELIDVFVGTNVRGKNKEMLNFFGIIKSYITNGAFLGTKTSDSIKGISTGLVNTVEGIVKIMANLSTSSADFNATATSFLNSGMASSLSNVYNNALASIIQTAINILSGVDNLSSVKNSISGDYVSVLGNVVDDINHMLAYVISIGSFDAMSEISGADGTLLLDSRETVTDKLSKINTILDMFAYSMHLFVDSMVLASNITPETFNVLRDGIMKICTATNEITDVGLFAQHTYVIDKYVRAINAIQVGKVESLTNAVMAMHALSNRLGNIDGLTTAIAQKLSVALDKLARELRSAERTIRDADKLQARRMELIDKGMQKVKDIMSQEMTVNIVNTQETTDDSSTVSASGDTSSGDTSTTIGGGTPTGTGSSSTSSYGTTATGAKNTGAYSGPDADSIAKKVIEGVKKLLGK